MTVTVETLTGAAFTAAIPAVARLRVAVFRAWPYLYDGSEDTETGYLARFAEARDAVIVAARDGGRIVGVATAAPLKAHTRAFAPLFEAHGFDPDRVFYFGESVLLEAYRGQGIGHAFFDAREAAARTAFTASGERFALTAFCGVVRADDDPRQPTGYVPLDAFWTKRGYRKVSGMLGSFAWREIGQSAAVERAETEKPMQFWVRRLETA